MAVSRLDEEDELIPDEPAVPSHSEAYTCLSACIRWLEAQTDNDVLLVYTYQS